MATNITGKRYGRLAVVQEVEPKTYSNGSKTRMFLCKCDCGNEKVIRLPQLLSGRTKSCGCMQKERASVSNRTHGLSKNNKRLYKVWKSMRARCNNPNDASYYRYGGIGIKVCDEWDKDFSTFYEWSIANGYKEDIAESGRNRLSIDRINNDGNYEPSNCRWADDHTQANNKRVSIPPEIKYAKCPICGNPFVRTSRTVPKTCSKTCGAKLSAIAHTIKKNYNKICPVCGKEFDAKRGGHFKDAVCCSRRCANLSNSPMWEYNSEKHRVVEWAEIVGVNAHCLLHRKELGWTMEEILTTPLRGRRSAKE